MKLESFMKKKSSICFFLRAILFVALFIYTLWFCVSPIPSTNSQLSIHRKLLQNGTQNGTICLDSLQKQLAVPGQIPEAFTYEQIKSGAFVFYFFGMLYMFLALSIVCDECFCPALDVATEALGLSPDVAGATLMAAGGSAPELATSFIGTFYDSDVGFGTIVGSAVFNVLFVIGMCVLCSSEILSLTWWPLFRDCTVYALGLAVLALFFTVITPNQIDWWEALILWLMYGGYVLLMMKNKQLEAWVNQCTASLTGKSSQHVKLEEVETKDEEMGADDPDPSKHVGQLGHRNTVLSVIKGEPLINTESQVIRSLKGSMDEIFNSIDVDGDGYIDHTEFTNMVQDQELDATDYEITELIKKLDSDNDGKISKVEFRQWYVASTKRVYKDAADAFGKFSKSQDGVQKLNKKKIKKVLSAIDKRKYKDTDPIVEQAHRDISSADETYITVEEFNNWYQNSALVEETLKTAKNAAETDLEVGGLSLAWPESARGRIWYLISFPLVMPMYFTVPNVQTDKWRNWWPFSFFMAIVWVAIYSIFMVQWATVFGLAIKIPTKVMGLIFLAAGTSIPDLLTSVSVAMAGKGDMAVSSSIGSNIFDILFGLPVPWLARSASLLGKPIKVGSPQDNVGLSVIILFAVVVLVIVTIAGVGWKLSKRLAIVFFLFYFIYVGQELIIYYYFGPGQYPPC